MPFAADDDHIARPGQSDRVEDGSLAVGHAEEVVPLRPVAGDQRRGGLSHNGCRIFGAGVFSGDHRHVGQPGRDLAHQAALTAVAQPG